jgi:hypothetical protein
MTPRAGPCGVQGGHHREVSKVATFYVLRPAHVTFYKDAVEADSLEEAKAKYADEGGEYVGYIDADWADGPDDDWSDPENSYVEGTG